MPVFSCPDRPPRARGIYCNRTLNLRSIRAVAYDMDYTLVHYRQEEWERRAYEDVRARLGELRWPVEGLEFDSVLVVRGLVVDAELGNLVKANRFGYVKRAMHGTRMLGFDEQRATYSRVLVDLRDPRWSFMHTLFSLSEGCLYAQLVEALDRHAIPGILGYADLYRRIRLELDAAHTEGRLKADIMATPERYVEPDPDLPLALLDQRAAGKKLLLITNSDWEYAGAMMSHAIDPFLGGGRAWRELFDLVVVGARKPAFFEAQNPAFEVDEGTGFLRPVSGGLQLGRTYLGGDAALVERALGIDGSEILHVGDHIWSDVHVSKSAYRWRTALVLRELEAEIGALASFDRDQARLTELMREKETLEWRQAQLRLSMQRLEQGYGPAPGRGAASLRAELEDLRSRLAGLDEQIGPLARRGDELLSRRWGLLMRAGNDKSHLARQVERHADIYTSRVSNFLPHTPFLYLRSPRSSLPHDDAEATTP